MDDLTLDNEDGRVVISPHAGASLRSLRVRSSRGGWYELLTGGDGPHDPATLPQGQGSFLMAPWPNRLRGGILHADGAEYRLPPNRGPHAIHGIARDRAWRVVAATRASVRLATVLDDPWPFRGSVVYEASLEGPALRQSLAIEAAKGERPFPAGIGWHPWFRRDLGTGSARVRVPGMRTVWEVDEGFSATGRQLRPEQAADLRMSLLAEPGRVDQCMRIDPGSPAVLEWAGAVRLEIRSSPEVSHLQVYTPEDSVCVEPESCTVNAFRLAAEGIEGTGSAEAAPGRPFSGWTRWSWT